MIKKERLKKEVKTTLKSIKILLIISFIFGFSVALSYTNVQNYYDSNLGTELLNQKGFDVFVTVRDSFIPIILISSNFTYVCEGGFIDFPVKVITFNGNVPTASLSITNPFYIIHYGPVDSITNEFRIVSGTLNKNDAGGLNAGSKTYPEIIYMSADEMVSSRDFNITVIEINNAPVIENIGVKTVWTQGDNDIFNYKVNVSDIEDGDSNSGNLTFNISFDGIKLFNITQNGTMFFKPNSSQIGVYNISVCVIDSGIKNSHPLIIEECEQDGSNLTICNNFSLTVTNQNRAPIITNHSPENTSISITGDETAFFNITSYDPDGTIVDVYWYVDEELGKYDSMSSQSNFSFSYICGTSGISNITAVITDGELNDSFQWNLSVSSASCPATSGGSGGGGGSGGVACKEKWVCGEWNECKNLKEGYNMENANYKINTLIGDRCKLFKWDDNICGFQTRECQDLKKCKSNLSIPGIMQECYFVKNPNCSDGIKNCHNGSCEIAIDCGGSCNSCPSCNDGIKNQNEEDIDCGGVCASCIVEITKSEFDFFRILMFISLIFLILALIGISILGIKYIVLKKKLGDIYYNKDSGGAEPEKVSYRRDSSIKREF